MIHGVNKSPGLASFYLRTFPLSQWLPMAQGQHAFVRFTVTGIARNFHPIPMTPSIRGRRRASLRRYTGYSFVVSIIGPQAHSVNCFFNLSLAIEKNARAFAWPFGEAEKGGKRAFPARKDDSLFMQRAIGSVPEKEIAFSVLYLKVIISALGHGPALHDGHDGAAMHDQRAVRRQAAPR